MENISSKANFNTFINKYFPEALLFVAFSAIQLRHINIDFWNDEIYTLKHFVFTSFQNTVTDYHVPNNHLFFNLVNNAYLKLTGINSFFTLLDNPYKLRLVTFIYSLLLFMFTYKTARRFLHRIVALLSVAILSTTIPYYNFALQIRGYGLSSLFLIMIVYYSISFLKSSKLSYLLIVSLLTGSIIYTVPSNLYPVLGILVFVFFNLFTVKQKSNRFSFFKLLSSQPFYLIISILFGISISLLLYSPIFKKVFLNSYVESGAFFQFSQLKFYIPNIFNGFVSYRWLLVVMFVAGILFLKRYKSWLPVILLLFTICLMPIILVYIRGDKAPLRTFVVLMPLLSILFSIGIFSFWKSIHKPGKYDLLFVGLVLLYSVITFVFELQKIEKQILADIKNDWRSQNLYYQYYSFHYQPLEDIKSFRRKYYNSKYPLVVVGCEPHGITNYLSKFEINHYLSEDFDSLLAVNDSIYIVTDYPYKFKNTADYTIDWVKPELTYHNVLVYYKNPVFFHELYSKLNEIEQEYKDSINYVFNVVNPSSLSEISKNNSCCFITDGNANEFGRLISFIKEKPFLLYFETVERNSRKILYTLHDQHNTILLSDTLGKKKLYILQENVSSGNPFSEIYFNDFENQSLKTKGKQLYDTLYSYSGKSSEKLDSNHIYSSTFEVFYSQLGTNTTIKVSLFARFEKGKSGVVVFEVNRDNKIIIWQDENIDNFYTTNNEWNKAVTMFSMDQNLKSEDRIKIYVWNHNKNRFWIDDLKVEVAQATPTWRKRAACATTNNIPTQVK